MKLKDARISILINQDSTIIELTDRLSAITFAEVRLTPLQLSQVLSRLAYTECEIEVFNLDKLNKKHEAKYHEFIIPDEYNRKDDEGLHILALESCPEGWEPEKYYGSQNSFFNKEGKKYARVVIRRWVEEPD